MPRILLVDDHTGIRQYLRRLLEKGGHCVVCAEAASGEEALRLAPDALPDLAVLDLSMGEMDGLEVAQALRAAIPGIRIVIVTTHRAGDPAELARSAGVDAWLQKSDAPRELLDTVLRLCAGGEAGRRA